MPKRVVDGEALWRSRKLLLVPIEYRGEYSNLLPLADVNGSFECDPNAIYADVYGYNRPNVTPTDVVAMLDAFEAAGMLVRWKQEGKTWGHFVGIEKPGRLPSGKHLTRHRNLPPLPPSVENKGSQDGPDCSGIIPDAPGDSGSVPENPPLGLGLGRGNGLGTPTHITGPNPDFDGSVAFEKSCSVYPKPERDYAAQTQYFEAIGRIRSSRQCSDAEADDWLHSRIALYAQRTNPVFAVGFEKFLRKEIYAQPEVAWGSAESADIPIRKTTSVPLSQRLEQEVTHAS